MYVIERMARETSWANIEATFDAGIPERVIHSGDIIPFNLKNGQEAALRVTQSVETKEFFFVLDDCVSVRKMNYMSHGKNAWADCDLRSALNDDMFYLLPDELQLVIKPTKIVQVLDGERIETEDKLFLLSRTQVFGKGEWSDCEPEDTQLDSFRHVRNRIMRNEANSDSSYWWWLRTQAGDKNHFNCVTPWGDSDSYSDNNTLGVIFAFRI